MAISLSDAMQQILEERLKRSTFNSADELIAAALEALDTIVLIPDEETLDAIDQAEAEGERGEGCDWEDIRDKLREKYFGEQ